MTFLEEMEAANAKYLDAMGRGDAEELASFFTEDALRIVPGKPVIKGRQAIKDDIKETIGDGFQITVSIVDVVEYGDLGVAVGTFDGGERTGKFLSVSHRQSDGTRLMSKQCIILD